MFRVHVLQAESMYVNCLSSSRYVVAITPVVLWEKKWSTIEGRTVPGECVTMFVLYSLL